MNHKMIALLVVAFVGTAMIARRVGQFEMKEQADRQIIYLQSVVGCNSKGLSFDELFKKDPLELQNCIHYKTVDAFLKGARAGQLCANYNAEACAEIAKQKEELGTVTFQTTTTPSIDILR